jgi:polyvinyl alcohol dehydrogenase (cytochrome)
MTTVTLTVPYGSRFPSKLDWKRSGDILNSKQAHDGANVIAVDWAGGNLRWKTQVDSHPAAIITGSPVVFDGVVYVGVSSNEETLAENPAYPCCSFRGSVVAHNVKTGEMLWKTFDMPENGDQAGGYSGERCGNHPRLMQSAVRSSSALATTMRHLQM